jgi:RHS repeat-associated protein
MPMIRHALATILSVLLVACSHGVDDPLSQSDETTRRRAQELVADADGDGIADSADNCPLLANTNQANTNGVGPGDACELSLVVSTGLLNQHARFQSHKELIASLYPLTFAIGPDLLSISAPAPALASPSVSLLAPRLGVWSLGELLPGYTDTIGGSEVLRVTVGSDSVLGGAKASRVWLRLDGSGTVQVSFIAGGTTLATQTATTSGTNLRMFDPGVLFDRIELRVPTGRIGLKGSGEVLMFALGNAALPCPAGYERVGGSCVDINECAGLNHGCDALTTCTNTPGSFSCGPCPSGYRGTGSTACVDIDECAEHTAICSTLVACSNTPGGYTCGACPTGYRGDGAACTDIDECAEHTAGCDALVTCTNSPGGYTCGPCPSGYTGGGATGCVDIDECSGPNRVCDALVACVNTQGGYTCGACPTGYRGTGNTSCLDVDECAERTATCSPLVACGNTPGGFQCGACPAGFTGDGSTCTDINECATGDHACDPLVVCTNTQGGYTCGTCPSGYTGDGRSCVDIDECASGSPCDPRTSCTNAAGAFLCGPCPAGFSGDGFVGCVDIDECAAGTDTCSELVTCGNTLGGYTCSPCPGGYEGDGHECVDVDECNSQPGLCGGSARCINVPGSYSCEDCPAGMTADGDACADIDECAIGTPCDPLSACSNTMGSYLCAPCPAGYVGSGYTGCLDVDECAVNNGDCLSDQRCVNDVGSVHCEGGCGGDSGAVTTCGLGECRASGLTSCVNDEIVDSCMPRYPPVYDTACLCTSKQVKAGQCVAGSVYQPCLAQLLDPDANQSDLPHESGYPTLSCNGKDDDCNGLVDDGFVPVQLAQTCGTGDCRRAAQQVCAAGQLVVSCTPGLPQSTTDATCNGRDEDCSGAADEDFVGVATVCGLGVCASQGTTSCVAGVLRDSCVPRTGAANDATCNNIDDDCDGRVDEDFVASPTGGTCGVGACLRQAVQACVSGAVTSSCAPGSPAASDTSCNGIDDDCDGQTDEDYVGTPVACGVGACAATGTTVCSAGRVSSVCTPRPPAASDATCDGIDDNCNGVADEGVTSSVVACAEPTSGCPSLGSLVCVRGQMAIQCTDFGGCSVETSCHDGIDDEGDGKVDCNDSDCSWDRGCFEDCRNDVDDDGDGDTDCFDSTCASVAPCIAEVCGNGVDDDGDGRPDCLDPSCATGPACLTIPPDPSTVALPIPPVPQQSMVSRHGFLMEGANPIQRGVTAVPSHQRSSLLSLRTVDSAGAPVAGVRVAVKGLPEWGYTVSRADGRADMLIEGGTDVTVVLSGSGVLPMERSVPLRWRNATDVGEVVVTPLDPHGTDVRFVPSSVMQTATGSATVDARGARQPVLLVPAGTQALLVAADGSTRPVNAGTVRITEYTAGSRGLDAMPAALPPNTGFTYAFELSVDEAISTGARTVEFTNPLPLYVDNFTRMPVGAGVPLGYYDFDCGCWKSVKNARVVRVVAIDGGRAQLDFDGDGNPETDATLEALGVTTDERARVAALYAPGKTLWRMSVSHFSPWDANHPVGPDDGGGGGGGGGGPGPWQPEGQPEDPDPEDPYTPDRDPLEQEHEEDSENECKEDGSIVFCARQALGESIPINGTPYSLEYSSAALRQRFPSYIDEVVTPAAPAPSFLGANVTVTIEGWTTSTQLGAAPRQTVRIAAVAKDRWDRALGSEPQEAKIKVCYRYKAKYLPANASMEQALGAFVGPSTTGVSVDVEYAQSPTLSACRTESRWVQRPAEEAPAAPENTAWTLDVLPRISAETHKLITSSGTENTNAEPVARRLDEVLSLENARDQPGGNPADWSLRGVLPNGQTILLRRSGAKTGGPYSVASGYGADYVGGTEDRGEIAYCPAGSTFHNPYYVPDGCTTSVLVMADAASGSISGYNYQEEARTYFDRDGKHAYVAMARNGSVWRFDVVEFSPWYNIGLVAPSRYIALKNGVPVIGTRAGFANQPTLDSLTATVVEDTQQVRTVSPAVGDTARFAAGGEGTLWVLTGTRAGANTRLWRVRPERIAERVTASLDQTFDYAIDPGPDGGVFLHGWKQETQASAMYFVSRAGELMPVYRPLACGNDSVTLCASGAWHYDAGSDRLLTGRLRTRTVGGQTYQDYYIVSHDFRSMVAQGGIDYLQTLRSPALFRFTRRYDDAKRAWPAWTWGIRTDEWLVTPSGAIRTLSQELGGLVDLTTEAAVSARAGKAYELDALGVLSQTRDPLTGAVQESFVYTNNRATAIVDGNGNTTTIERNGDGTIASIVAPTGQRTGLEYDLSKRLITVTRPDSAAAHFTYHGVSQLLATYTDFVGKTSTFSFDGQGYLERDESPSGWAQTLSGSAVGTARQVVHTDADGVSKTLLLNQQHGESLVATFADGTKSSQSISADGSQSIDAKRNGTQITRAMLPDPVLGAQASYAATIEVRTPQSRTLRASVSRAASRDGAGNVTSRVETSTINGNTWSVEHDFVQNKITTTSPAGRKWSRLLDSSGNVIEESSPDIATIVYGRDLRGRIRTVTQGTRQVVLDIPSDGVLGGVTSNSGNTFSFDHDPIGRPTVLRAGGAIAGTLRYDALRVRGFTPPGRAEYGFDYRDDGVPSTVTMPESPTQTFIYTPAKRFTEWQVAGVTRRSITPDALGRVHDEHTAEGHYIYTYDPSTAELASATSPGAPTLGWAKDGDLLRTEWWTRGSSTSGVTYDYDASWRVSMVQVTGTGSSAVSTYGYDADDLITSVRLPNAQGSSLVITRSPTSGRADSDDLGAVNITYGYSDFGERDDISATAQNTAVYERQNVVRDLAGRVRAEDVRVQGTLLGLGYHYDAQGRLDEVRENGSVVRSYGYDANGNRKWIRSGSTEITADYDGADRLKRFGTITYGYDDVGQLRTKDDPSEGTTAYTYGTHGELRQVDLPDGRALTYENDAMGRRVGRTLDGTTTARWVYVGIRPVAELDASNTIRKVFVYTDGLAPDVAVIDGVAYRIVADARGSVRLVVNAATGAVAQRIDYDEFGRVLSDTNPGLQPFGFAGGLYDADTGMVRFGARDYDALIGRWASRDPVLFAGAQANLYTYVGNDPVNEVDPSGRSKFDKFYNLPKQFWHWYHRQYKKAGDLDLDEEEAKELYEEWKNCGKPGPDSKKKKRPTEEGEWDIDDWLDLLPIPFPDLLDPCVVSPAMCGGPLA